MEVWTWLNDGIPKGFFKSENSLLISYDMIPLRGLDETRKVLNEKGRIAVGCLVEDDTTSLFVPIRDDKPDLDAIDWGCRGDEYDRCLRSLCAYVSYIPGYENENKFGLSEDENETLRQCEWRILCSDKRRRRPLPRLKVASEAILAEIGFQIKTVKFTEDCNGKSR